MTGMSSSGRSSVVDIIGSLKAPSRACAMGWPGTRKPIVLRRLWTRRRGTSRVAGSTNVKGPGR